MNKLEILKNLYPEVKIDSEGFPGFKRDGWVVWSPLSPKDYLKNLGEWTDQKEQARVFADIETAVAVCTTWQYFACSTGPKVVRAIKGGSIDD